MKTLNGGGLSKTEQDPYPNGHTDTHKAVLPRHALVLFMPNEHQSVEATAETQNRLVLLTLPNVTSEVGNSDFRQGRLVIV